MKSTTSLVPLAKIKANPDNPRVLKDDKFQKLVASLETFPDMLELRPIVVDETWTVLGGNMRLRALQHLKVKEVPVTQVEGLTPEQKREFIIKDNASFGEWDWDILANEWDASQLEEWGLDVWTPELEPTEGLTDPDDVPEVPEEPKTKSGDLYILGKHRLLCGDSTNSEHVARLMDGKQADMVFTDPPYGISHSGKGIKGDAKENDFGEILGDNDVTVAIDAFNLCQSLFSDATMIFWGANYYSSCLPNGFGWLVWDKQREGDTFSGAELAFVNKGVKVDVFRHQWHGMIKGSEMGEKRVHPTQKPIALVTWSFNNYKAQDNILDLFLGSGSTLIAAEKTGRTCYGMEIDPKYCDVIVKRWEDFTGKKAELVR